MDKPRTQPRARGDAIEAASLAYLRRAGLREIATNANYRFGELDLVMLDQGGPAPTLVFVEVRYRRSDRFGGGAASVDVHKRRRIVHAAQAFLHAHREHAEVPCRFDVVEADGEASSPRLRWLRDAFRLDDC